MSDFYIRYPSFSGSNASVGTNNTTAPTSSTEIGGVNAGNLIPVAVDSSGQVKVVVDSTTAVSANVTKWGGASTTLGQKTMASSVPVVLSSDQSTVSVSGPLTDTQLRASAVPVSGPLTDTQLRASAVPVSAASLPLPSGAATEATLSTLNGKVTACNTGAVTISAALPAGTAVIGKVSIDQTTPGTTNLVALAANQTVNVAQINAVTPLMGNGVTGTGSQRVTIASDNTAFTVNAAQSGTWTFGSTTSGTSTLSSVNSSASSVSLLALNASRKQAMFFNDSTAILYLKFGTTASTTSYTVQLQPSGYFEMPIPAVYTGAIDGIWSAANGAVRITELT